MTLSDLPMLLLQFVILLPALVLHEVAHGWMAYRLGDPTAKMMGRLNLDPRKHIDPWGTILMPLLLLFVSGGKFAFGYAKPVPFNPRYFKNYKTGMLLTGVAGPAMNLALALAGAVLFRGLYLLADLVSVPGIVLQMAYFFVYLNLLLLFFNLIPIPPLDGAHILFTFLPRSQEDFKIFLQRYGFVFLFIIIYFLSPIMDPILMFLYRLIVGVPPV